MAVKDTPSAMRTNEGGRFLDSFQIPFAISLGFCVPFHMRLTAHRRQDGVLLAPCQDDELLAMRAWNKPAAEVRLSQLHPNQSIRFRRRGCLVAFRIGGVLCALVCQVDSGRLAGILVIELLHLILNNK